MSMHTLRALHAVMLALSSSLPLAIEAAEVPPAEDRVRLEAVEVRATRSDVLGTAEAASQGIVTREQILSRPLFRPGELLETVPGVIVTQHSGSGKANQFFLRGFNLDHGTDFFTTVGGMPVNMPTHGHGQGYSDLNFIIPELIDRIQYQKGPYHADTGDFAAAGAAHIDYLADLGGGLVDVTAGRFGYRRGLIADSPAAGAGRLLYALEVIRNDGPWDVAEDLRKVNGVLRYGQGTARDGFSVTAMAYRGRWNATDQIPARALEQGVIGRFGNLDSTDGGVSRRASLSADWSRSTEGSITRVSAYVIDYRLDLFSNFTYVLNDPANGDQFQQSDRRVVSGARASHTWLGSWADREVENVVGIDLRNDNIARVGLYNTARRERLSTVREDGVVQTSASLYGQNTLRWTDRMRTIAGLRADRYRVKVGSDNEANSGTTSAHLFSPKLGLILGPWQRTEIYANAGYGFHSNDARGTTITVDPSSGDPAERVPLLVRAKGRELGLRTEPVGGLQSTLSVWRLDIASELVFVGDAGSTEASFPSRRTGIEWSNVYKPVPWMTLDLGLGLSRARFNGNPAGDRVPGAIGRTLTAGVALEPQAGWFGSVRLRYFGPRPLIEDNSVRSPSTTLVNLMAGYRLSKSLTLRAEVFNLFDRKASDIDYFYCSRLPSDPPGAMCADGSAGVDDIHTHPVEPRALRVSLSARF